MTGTSDCRTALTRVILNEVKDHYSSGCTTKAAPSPALRPFANPTLARLILRYAQNDKGERARILTPALTHNSLLASRYWSLATGDSSPGRNGKLASTGAWIWR